MLRASGKPAVGHNCMLDVAYTTASFAQSLPGTWPDYKGLLRYWFPSGIYDTKHLATRLVRDDEGRLPAEFSSGLGSLYELLKCDEGVQALAAWAGAAGWAAPVIEHAEGYDQYKVCCRWLPACYNPSWSNANDSRACCVARVCVDSNSCYVCHMCDTCECHRMLPWRRLPTKPALTRG